MPNPSAPAPAPDKTVPVRHFWPLIPVVVALAIAFRLWWPDAPPVLRALVGTAAMVVTATVVVLVAGRRSTR